MAEFSFYLFNQQLNGLHKIKTTMILPIYQAAHPIFLQHVSSVLMVYIDTYLTSFYISETKCKRLDMTPVSKSQASSNLIKNIEQIKGH